MKIFYMLLGLVLLGLFPILFCSDACSVTLIHPNGYHQRYTMLMSKSNIPNAPGGPKDPTMGYQREGLPRSFSFPSLPMAAYSAPRQPKVVAKFDATKAAITVVYFYVTYRGCKAILDQLVRKNKRDESTDQ